MKTKMAVLGLAFAGALLVGCGDDDGIDAVDTTTGSESTLAASPETTEGPVTTKAEAAGSAGGGLTPNQRTAIDKTIDSAAAEGLVLDRTCVTQVVVGLSDEDATAIANDDVNISEEARAASLQLINCADPEAIADLFIEGMRETADDFDEACVREKLGDFDLAELVAATQGGGQPPADLIAAMIPCFEVDPGLSADQQAAVDRTIADAAESGVALDPACVAEVVKALSDTDVAAVAAGNDAGISPEGQAAAVQLINCADEDAIADLFIEGMREAGADFDEACVREKLGDFDVAELVVATQGGGQPPADIVAAMIPCFLG